MILIALVVGLSGCTVHPPGERELREQAIRAGEPYSVDSDRRTAPPLPADATADDLVRHALLTNAGLEQKYWEWRAAIEQIPQDGTQPTNLVLFAGVPIEKGSTAFDRTTVTVANDPMADIVWPSKLSTAAQRALNDAKAAGIRFQKAKYDLRNSVRSAYYDYTLIGELIALEQSNLELLKMVAMASGARNRAGAGGQQDVLKAQNEIDLSLNDIARMRSDLITRRAALNAQLNRAANSPLHAPTTMPATQPITQTDDEILALAAERNPELVALSHELQGKADAIRLARLQYFPDFSASFSTDLGGTMQNLMGMITVPVLRHEAIDAAIEQARANLRATDAMRRQTGNDLAARIIDDLATLRDADRQLDLFEHTILPRAQQVVSVARTSYESSRSSLLDLLGSQRSLIAIERLVTELRAIREKRLADLEAITANRLTLPSATTASFQ